MPTHITVTCPHYAHRSHACAHHAGSDGSLHQAQLQDPHQTHHHPLEVPARLAPAHPRYTPLACLPAGAMHVPVYRRPDRSAPAHVCTGGLQLWLGLPWRADDSAVLRTTIVEYDGWCVTGMRPRTHHAMPCTAGRVTVPRRVWSNSRHGSTAPYLRMHTAVQSTTVHCCQS